MRGSSIGYVYVSKDVTLSREKSTQVSTWTDDDGNEQTYTTIYNKFSLSLKSGWNLVQIDNDDKATNGTTTVKFADKDVPWSIDIDQD
jgi:hypothetical protein